MQLSNCDEFWLLDMNCVSWLATKYKPTFMCLRGKLYQMINFVIDRLDDTTMMYATESCAYMIEIDIIIIM